MAYPEGDLTAVLEPLAYAAWPAAEVQELEGWRLRANHGVTNRASSVWPARPPEEPDSLALQERIDLAEAFYAHRGQPARFQLTPLAWPAGLDAARGYERYSPVQVQVAEVATLLEGLRETPAAECQEGLSEAWFELSGRRGPLPRRRWGGLPEPAPAHPGTEGLRRGALGRRARCRGPGRRPRRLCRGLLHAHPARAPQPGPRPLRPCRARKVGTGDRRYAPLPPGRRSQQPRGIPLCRRRICAGISLPLPAQGTGSLAGPGRAATTVMRRARLPGCRPQPSPGPRGAPGAEGIVGVARQAVAGLRGHRHQAVGLVEDKHGLAGVGRPLRPTPIAQCVVGVEAAPARVQMVRELVDGLRLGQPLRRSKLSFRYVGRELESGVSGDPCRGEAARI